MRNTSTQAYVAVRTSCDWELSASSQAISHITNQNRTLSETKPSYVAHRCELPSFGGPQSTFSQFPGTLVLAGRCICAGATHEWKRSPAPWTDLEGLCAYLFSLSGVGLKSLDVRWDQAHMFPQFSSHQLAKNFGRHSFNKCVTALQHGHPSLGRRLGLALQAQAPLHLQQLGLSHGNFRQVPLHSVAVVLRSTASLYVKQLKI